MAIAFSGKALAGVVDYLVTIGDVARYYVEGAIRGGCWQTASITLMLMLKNDPELEAAKHAADPLKSNVHPGDLVLLTGSRGKGMETILAIL